MRRARFVPGAVAVGGLLFGLTACTGDSAPVESSPSPVASQFVDGTTMERLASAGRITIGTTFERELFAVETLDERSGFDVEIGELLAAQLGIAPEQIEWVDIQRGGYMGALEEEAVDIVVAPIEVAPDATSAAALTEPYLLGGQSYLTVEGNDDITTADDLVGQPVCAVGGTPEAARLAELGSVTIAMDSLEECVTLVLDRQVVAVSADLLALASVAAEYDGDVAVSGARLTTQGYAIAAQQDDEAFAAWIDGVVDEAILDGAYEAIWNETAGAVLPYADPRASEDQE